MYPVVKRSFDIMSSLLGLMFLSPILIAAGFAVWVSMGSPILFRQSRPGLHGELFELLKFRTMSQATDDQGQPLADALRITAVGSFLRKWSIDELPELINVLRGEMSLVGPRPLLAQYLPLYSEHQARRHEVKPGLTGWAQINGRNRLSWQEKFDMDVWYVDHAGFWLDLKILAKTMIVVAHGRDVSEEGQATARPFIGN